MSKLGIVDQLLKILELATVAAGALSGHPDLSALGLKIEQIAATAIEAHEQITGKPFDVSLLKPIDPVT